MRSKNNKLILQCEEFEKFAEPRFDELWKDRKVFFAAQVTQERIYRSKCLKQADVLMLMFLFYDRFTEEEIRTAWDYYLPYTTHDSSLSAGIHAIMALRLGLYDEAWQMFQHSKGSDLDVNHGGASEGIHIAGCGSNWQMIVFGVAGMRNALQSQILTLQPRLPKQWKSLTFPIVWKEHALQITLEPTKTTIKNKSSLDIEVLVDNQKRTVPAGKEEIFISK